MKRLLAVAAAVLLALGFVARAAGPDDEYLSIYYLIQQGENAEGGGKKEVAARSYRNAQTELQRLQKAYPDWQTNVVEYRLKYLAKRLAELNIPPPAKAVPGESPGRTIPNADRSPGVNEVLQQQLAYLQTQLQQLQANNESLEARLREAFSVRPTEADPAQLAKAEETIGQLARENELLKVSLNDAEAKASATESARQIAQLRRDLEASSKQLAVEADRARKLAREKGDLENRLSKTVTSPRDSSPQRAAQRELDDLQQRLTAQQAVATQLQRERGDLLEQLKSLEAEAAAAGALRAENEVLRRQVTGLKAATTGGEATAQLSARLVAAEAQIAALQSERSILLLERAALEGRVVQFMAAATPGRPDDAQRTKELEREIAALQRQLAEANRRLAEQSDATSGLSADALAAQLAAARARLDVYEARRVPYSAEELALFRQTTPRLASTDRPARKSSAIPKPPAGSAALVSEAQRHFAQREYAQAEAKYQEVLQMEATNVYTLANLAAIQLEEGKLEEAEAHLRRALTIAPDDAYSIQTLGYLKFRQKDYDDALTQLSRAAQLDPSNAEIQNYLGVTLSHLGQRAAAETALRKAVELEPGYASAHNNLAVVYATQTPPAVALARWHYQKALDSGHPENPQLERLFDQKDAAPTP